eukprot:3056330-Amphidinium_carterae.1
MPVGGRPSHVDGLEAHVHGVPTARTGGLSNSSKRPLEQMPVPTLNSINCVDHPVSSNPNLYSF